MTAGVLGIDPEAFLRGGTPPPAKPAKLAKVSGLASNFSSFSNFSSPTPPKSENTLADDLARRASRAAEAVAAMEVDEGERAAIAHHDGGVPLEWAEGFARLQLMPCPDGLPERRWLRLIDDAGRFLDTWAARASALGWGTADVWGCHPSAPRARVDCLGLVGLLDGAAVVALAENTVTVRTPTGATQTITRRPMPGAVPVWTLGETTP